MTVLDDARELSDFELAQVSGAGFELTLPPLPWPNGPILTGTGPYGGDPVPSTTR